MGYMTSIDPFVPKGQPRTPGDQTCGYKPATASDYCGVRATWHVMWDGELDNSFTCDEHMELIQRRWMYEDRHPVVADCGMPGALWKYKDKRCEFPTTGPTSAANAVEEVPDRRVASIGGS